jgi:two-component system NarL family response regulator
MVVPPGLLGPLVRHLLTRQGERTAALLTVARLSPREREVLSLLGRGVDNRSIADALLISPQTARTHVQNILSKLRVHSRAEAASVALRAGIAEELLIP